MGGMVFNILMYAAPLSVLRQVLRDKSSSSLPRQQCILGLFCTSLWLHIGVSKSSLPIAVPNFAGLILSLAQLSLIVYFPASSKLTKSDGFWGEWDLDYMLLDPPSTPYADLQWDMP